MPSRSINSKGWTAIISQHQTGGLRLPDPPGVARGGPSPAPLRRGAPEGAPVRYAANENKILATSRITDLIHSNSLIAEALFVRMGV